MPREEIDFRPVTHIITDAIGPPGKRVFYIQSWKDDRTITLIAEKLQIQSLAVSVEQFLAEISEKFPDLSKASASYEEEKMHIQPPVDPLFRIGEIGLGYNVENDLAILVTHELLNDDQDPEEGRVVRFWCTRSQLRSMCHWGLEIASRGRPICSQCGEPEDLEGHFCPKKNGHKS